MESIIISRNWLKDLVSFSDRDRSPAPTKLYGNSHRQMSSQEHPLIGNVTLSVFVLASRPREEETIEAQLSIGKLSK